MLARLVVAIALLVAVPAVAQDTEALEDVGGDATIEEATEETPSDDDAGEADEADDDADEADGDEAAETRTESPVPAAAASASDGDDGDGGDGWRVGRMPTLRGQSGLFHISTADGLPAGTLGLGLHGEWFSASDVVRNGDENARFIGTLSLSWAPTEFLEAYFNFSARGNSNNLAVPNLIQSLGDVWLGAKVFTEVSEGLSVGGDLGLRFLNSANDVGIDFSATSVDIRALLSYALQDTPLAFHLNLGVFVDNSPNLFQNAAGQILPLQRVERFAQQVSDFHMVEIGIGVEVPLDYVTPFLEWNLGIPFGGEDLNDCARVIVPCPADAGFGSYPDILTIGVRGAPTEGLTLDLGVDLGLTNTEASGLPAVAPYNIVFGLAYNLDPAGAREPEVVYVETPAAIPPTGWVLGEVVDEESSEPIAGAVVSYPGTELSAQVSAENGRFRSYEQPVGSELSVRVEAPDYEAREFTRVIPEGQDGLRIRLRPIAGGAISGRVSDPQGEPLPATVYLNGPSTQQFEVDPITGEYDVRVDAGEYVVTVVADGYGSDRERMDIQTPVTHDVTLRRLAEGRRAVLRGDRIDLSGERITFDDDELTDGARALLDEVAGLMRQHPDIELEVIAHSDDRGTQEETDAQAAAVVDYLIQAGIDAERLQGSGRGSSEPLFPNISQRNRERNNRVDLIFPSFGR
jgi:OOP family OmpA-OmpF porin